MTSNIRDFATKLMCGQMAGAQMADAQQTTSSCTPTYQRSFRAELPDKVKPATPRSGSDGIRDQTRTSKDSGPVTSSSDTDA